MRCAGEFCGKDICPATFFFHGFAVGGRSMGVAEVVGDEVVVDKERDEEGETDGGGAILLS